MNIEFPFRISGVYAFVNELDGGRAYVGSSIDLIKRLAHHRYCLEQGRHKNYKLQKAWDEFGSAAFRVKILLSSELISEEDLRSEEQKLISSMRTHLEEFGYNIHQLVDRPTGIKRTEQSKARMSGTKKKLYQESPEFREHLKELGRKTGNNPEHQRKAAEAFAKMAATSESYKQTQREATLKRLSDPAERIKDRLAKGSRWFICNENGVKYLTSTDAAKDLNVDASSIRAALQGRYKQAGGYTFTYCEKP
jgi:group I intron endonuclease